MNNERFLGAQKIKAMLGIDLSHQKVHGVLVEAGPVKQGPKRRRVWRSFSRRHSNSLWQCDVMDLDDTKTKFLVTLKDDRSRYVLASKVLASVTGEAIVEMLRSAVRMLGRPRQILTDHGCQFWHNKSEGPTAFGRACRELGIKHIMAGVRRPTTCGKIERWHRSFQEELCSRLDWDVGRIEQELPKYLEWDNTERPHFAVGLEAPGRGVPRRLYERRGFCPGDERSRGQWMIHSSMNLHKPYFLPLDSSDIDQAFNFHR